MLVDEFNSLLCSQYQQQALICKYLFNRPMSPKAAITFLVHISRIFTGHALKVMHSVCSTVMGVAIIKS
jgi:hypothetical protein